MCLFANVTVLLRSGSIEDVVKDYVAVAVISGIDNQMASTFSDPGFATDLNLYMSHDRANLSDVRLFETYVLGKNPFAKKIDEEDDDDAET